MGKRGDFCPTLLPLRYPDRRRFPADSRGGIPGSHRERASRRFDAATAVGRQQMARQVTAKARVTFWAVTLTAIALGAVVLYLLNFQSGIEPGLADVERPPTAHRAAPPRSVQKP
jgi:hypothetical protein